MSPLESRIALPIDTKDHKFTPSEVHVPTGKPVMLVVTNLDEQTDEFEMHFPALEKVFSPGGTVKLRMRLLGPGSFPLTAEFRAETAKGRDRLSVKDFSNRGVKHRVGDTYTDPPRTRSPAIAGSRLHGLTPPDSK